MMMQIQKILLINKAYGYKKTTIEVSENDALVFITKAYRHFQMGLSAATSEIRGKVFR